VCRSTELLGVVKMKSVAVIVVALLVLTVSAVDETDVNRRRVATTMLTELRAAVKQIEFLADEIDAALQLAGVVGDRDPDNWIPPSIYKRDDGKRRAGRRRFDAYGVGGRFGRSAQ